ncbi:DNA helicase RecD, partial [Streptomyces sp. NPDC006999]
MSTEPPETTENAEPGTPGEASDTADASSKTPAEPESAAAEGEQAPGARQVSEAEAELLAQRAERERIERRKAERQEPIAAGGKLSGTAADLLAAVRAVESGEKPAAAVSEESQIPKPTVEEYKEITS